MVFCIKCGTQLPDDAQFCYQVRNRDSGGQAAPPAPAAAAAPSAAAARAPRESGS